MVLKRHLLWLAFWAFFAPLLTVGQTVNFSISAQEITTDQNLVLTVEASGGNSMGSPAFPEIDGFLRIGTAQNSMIVNGRMSATFSCRYKPVQTGNFTIPSFPVLFGKKTFRSPAWKVVVNQGNTAIPPQSAQMGMMIPQKHQQTFERMMMPQNIATLPFDQADNGCFLSVEMSKSTAYPGEQILAVVVLYMSYEDYQQKKVLYDDPGIQELVDRFKSVGFWEEPLPVIRNNGIRFMRGGKEYCAITLFKTIVYPLAPGTLNFDHLFMDAQKAKGKPKGFDFFGRAVYDYSPIKIKAAKKEFVVQSLPPTTLPHSGIAGIFDMKATLSQDSLMTGETTELRVVVSGVGNVAMLDNPLVEWPTGVEVYDPTTHAESSITSEDVLGTKTFTWQVMATQPGDRMIGPIKLYFFHASKQSYDSLVVPPFKLHAEGEDLVNARMKSQENDEFYLAAFANAQNDFRGTGGGWEKWLLFGCVALLVGAAGWRILALRKQPKAEPEKDFKPAPPPSFWES